MENKIEFKKLLSLLSERYNMEVSKGMTQIIWEALKPFDDEKCIAAFKWVLLHGRFAKDILPDLLSRLEVDKVDQGLIAWIEVDKAVHKYGPYQSVKFSDPVIHGVISSLGGWPKFQDCTEGEWKWIQKDFISRYKVMVKGTQEHPGHLPGIHEIENTSRGYLKQISPPVFINFDSPQMMLAAGEAY